MAQVTQRLRGGAAQQGAELSSRSCNVVALDHGGSTASRIVANPDASTMLPAQGELILVGTDGAESRFVDEFGTGRRRRRTTQAAS